MTGVFSGGLVYEFTEEPNKYGLVELEGDAANVMSEYDTLVTAFANAPSEPSIPSSVNIVDRPVDCPAENTFKNINGNTTLPNTLGQEYIDSGVDKTTFVKGKFLSLDSVKMSSSYNINDSDGNEISDKTIEAVASVSQAPIPEGGHGINTGGGVGTGGVTSSRGAVTGNGSDDDDANGAVATAGNSLGWSLALIAVGFAAFL